MVRALIALPLIAFLSLSGAASADAQSVFVEGEHYAVLATPQPAQSGEVKEFFSYGCPHCFEFEESLDPWLENLPEGVSFERVPAGLGKRFFQLMAVMYHMADHLGVSAQMHPVLFDQIHVKRNQQIGSPDVLAGLFETHAGITRAQFDQALNSQDVLSAFQNTEGMQARYELRGVPMMVVNGRYRVSRNQHVTSYPMMLEVVDHLLQQDAGSEQVSR